MKKIILSGLAAAMLFSGCTTRITDFTVISTKNVDLSELGKYERSSERIKGEDNLYFLFVLPMGTKIDLKEAIDNGIEQVPGAVALVDGVVYYRGWHIGLFGEQAYVVEGTPLVNPKHAAAIEGLPSKYVISKWNEDSQSIVNKYVSAKEFASLKSKYTDNVN